ncbi:MAG TPA: hypothetical protein DC000_04800, partial [Clostridiales bacterium]|nr:hypothetical protein [Clostridiales bacterium]
MNFIIDIEKRAEVVGNDIVKNNSTIRDTARRLKMSRSTVYNDYRLLKKTNIKLFESAEKIILNNKNV